MSNGPVRVSPRRPWWPWALVVVVVLAAILFFLLDALAGTHGV